MTEPRTTVPSSHSSRTTTAHELSSSSSSSATASSATTIPHIRPRRRHRTPSFSSSSTRRNDNDSDNAVASNADASSSVGATAAAAATQRRTVQSWCQWPPKKSSQVAIPKSIVTATTPTATTEPSSTDGSNTRTTHPHDATTTSVGTEEEDDSAVLTTNRTNGILRSHPKYSATPTTTTTPTPTTTATPTTTTTIQSLVVERPRRRRTRTVTPHHTTHPTTAPTATAIEGYTPRHSILHHDHTKATATTTKSVTIHLPHERSHATKEEDQHTQPPVTAQGIQDKNDNDDNEPLILSSLTDLLEAAGTMPDDDGTTTPHIIEADLAFSCVDPDAYTTHMREQHARFLGHDRLFARDDVGDTPNDDTDRTVDDSTVSDENAHADGDGDTLWDVLGLGDDDDDERDQEPTPPPRAFLQLWTALAQWITPAAVRYVQTGPWQQPSQHHDSMNHRDDVSASRCAGLMAVCRMHTQSSFEALQQQQQPCHLPHANTVDIRAAESRLADLIRCFDCTRPTPKMDTALSRALTCVLLHTVLRMGGGTSSDETESSNDDNDTTGWRVPAPCRALDMQPEEYRYLVRSGVSNFGIVPEASGVDLAEEGESWPNRNESVLYDQ